jgi:hypothetical protein
MTVLAVLVEVWLVVTAAVSVVFVLTMAVQRLLRRSRRRRVDGQP